VEADEPLTAEDIAAGVKAVNAFKQSKAKVKIYCGVVDIEDFARNVEAAGKAAAPKSVDPKAEEALDAKVKSLLARWAKISATPIMRWQACRKIPPWANPWLRRLKNWTSLAIARASKPS
jgi:hypothetical protein